MSLAEVLVAMTLLGVLSTLLTATVVLALRVSSTAQDRADVSSEGELAVMTTSKVLRTAVLPDQLEEQVCEGCGDTAIVRATPTEVTFYANLDNTGQGPSLVTFTVVEDPGNPRRGALRQRTQPPIALGDGRYTYCQVSLPTCVVRTRMVAHGLVSPTSAAFSYYDFSGLRITASTLGATDLTRVASIDVTFPMGGRGGPATTAVQRVRLPNADINVLVQPT
jgi:hypothetical protein